MSSYTITSGILTAVIDEHAAEMHSLKRLDNNDEMLWQGDPAYWTGRNPTLFPMVGSTWDNEIHIGGQTYHMGNHGFARHSDFTCTEHDDIRVVMELRDSEDTLAQYPFHFILRNTYSVRDNILSISCTVTNTNEVTMPFNFGFHPAFNVPLSKNAKAEDTRILFNQPQKIKGAMTTSMPLYRDLLAATIILERPRSTKFTLTDGIRSLTVTAPDFPWVAFWSPKAPFVCIEPWHSHTDFGPVSFPFEQREGTLLLEPGKTFTTGYTITVD